MSPALRPAPWFPEVEAVVAARGGQPAVGIDSPSLCVRAWVYPRMRIRGAAHWSITPRDGNVVWTLSVFGTIILHAQGDGTPDQPAALMSRLLDLVGIPVPVTTQCASPPHEVAP